MKQYRYVKSNAFTSGSIPEQSSPTRSLSLGNPAACIFTGQEELTPEQMQAIAAETNRKGIIEVFNAIEDEDAVYITAPDPIEHPMNLLVAQIEDALTLPHGSIRNDRIFNSVKLKCQDGEVLFGGKATKKIEGEYFI